MGGASGLLARLPDITPHPAMISISYACTGNIMQCKAFDVACQWAINIVTRGTRGRPWV